MCLYRPNWSSHVWYRRSNDALQAKPATRLCELCHGVRGRAGHWVRAIHLGAKLTVTLGSRSTASLDRFPAIYEFSQRLVCIRDCRHCRHLRLVDRGLQNQVSNDSIRSDLRRLVGHKLDSASSCSTFAESQPRWHWQVQG